MVGQEKTQIMESKERTKHNRAKDGRQNCQCPLFVSIAIHPSSGKHGQTQA